MANTIFFTGGSGFVGSNLIPLLKQAGYEVRALARSDKSFRVVESYGAKGVVGDITDYASLEESLQGCDTVVHAAAHMDFWGPKVRLCKSMFTAPRICCALPNKQA